MLNSIDLTTSQHDVNDSIYKTSCLHIQVHLMPKSHKRWTSYELMLKRVKKRPYYIDDMWGIDPSKGWFMTTKWTRDLRDPEIIASYREIRATNRAWWAEVHGMVLALAMVFHPRLVSSNDVIYKTMCLDVSRHYVCCQDAQRYHDCPRVFEYRGRRSVGYDYVPLHCQGHGRQDVRIL